MKDIISSILGTIKGAGLAVLVSFVKTFLEKAAQNLWDELWSQIFKAVEFAEKQWAGGETRKPIVVEWIMGWIQTKADLNWIQRQALKILLNQVVDAIIEAANAELGHDWVKRVESLERELADKIPFIK